MKIVIASNNTGKIKEIKEKLPKFEIVSLKEEGIEIEIEENGNTYEENALLKARTIRNITGECCISDDSGLEIEALPNILGLHTARFMGENTHMVEKMEEILKRMEKVPFEQRQASFICCIAICFPNGEEKVFTGECKGYIFDKIEGKGFGYDPIFYMPKYKKTFGQMEIELKNKLSHRGIALEKVENYLHNIKNGI